jgi:hypothetical protein
MAPIVKALERGFSHDEAALPPRPALTGNG